MSKFNFYKASAFLLFLCSISTSIEALAVENTRKPEDEMDQANQPHLDHDALHYRTPRAGAVS